METKIYKVKSPDGSVIKVQGPIGASQEEVIRQAQQLSSNQMAGNPNEEYAVDGTHVIHVSMSDGMTASWPFGQSILESVFKVYKQKELLEDAIIIYRIQRAPERRVFYVDVGNMPAHMAMAFVERVKNEIHQRRIPSQTGGGSSIMAVSYTHLRAHET